MTVLEYLEKHLSKEKATLVLSYINGLTCGLQITRPRKTKRGDFRQKGQNLNISVNHDENSYRFLLTLIHEIAHLKTYVEYKKSVKPHGTEWKKNFRQCFDMFRMQEDFGRDIEVLQQVQIELTNPSACSGVSLDLERVLSKYDSHYSVYLEDVPIGGVFVFGRATYQKLANRRTRALCLNMANNKKYTINKAALVQPSE